MYVGASDPSSITYPLTKLPNKFHRFSYIDYLVQELTSLSSLIGISSELKMMNKQFYVQRWIIEDSKLWFKIKPKINSIDDLIMIVQKELGEETNVSSILSDKSKKTFLKEIIWNALTSNPYVINKIKIAYEKHQLDFSLRYLFLLAKKLLLQKKFKKSSIKDIPLLPPIKYEEGDFLIYEGIMTVETEGQIQKKLLLDQCIWTVSKNRQEKQTFKFFTNKIKYDTDYLKFIGNLENFHIIHSKFTFPKNCIIPYRKFRTNKKCKTLIITNEIKNESEGRGLKVLINSLSFNSSLTKLEITGLKGSNLTIFSKFLKINTSIRILDLCHGQSESPCYDYEIHDEIYSLNEHQPVFFDALSMNRGVTKLRIAFNDKCAKEFFQAFQKNNCLTKINFECCFIKPITNYFRKMIESNIILRELNFKRSFLEQKYIIGISKAALKSKTLECIGFGYTEDVLPKIRKGENEKLIIKVEGEDIYDNDNISFVDSDDLKSDKDDNSDEEI